MYIIAIDSGTTNSRIRLVKEQNFEIVDVVKRQVGVKNTAIEGHPGTLKREIAKGLKEILANNNLTESDVKYIVSAGMITSNLGLYEVPHLPCPASLKDLAKASVIKVLPDFLDIPCVFIPGLKTVIHEQESVQDINGYDVMRGEEVESFGLINQLRLEGKGILALPGSHTKYVFMEDGNITSSISTLCGEMLHAISKETILSSSLDETLIEHIDEEALLNGFKAGRKFGLSRAFFHIRLLQVFEKMNKNQRANYLVGSVLAADIHSLSHVNVKDADWILIGGSNPLRKAFYTVFHQQKIGNVMEASDEQVELSTVIGAIQVAKSCI